MKRVNSYNKFSILKEKNRGIIISMVHIDYYYITIDKLHHPIFDYCTYNSVGVAICEKINKL